METTEIKLQPVTDEKDNSLNSFQQQALEAAEKELEALKEKMENQKYLVDLSKSEIEMLNNFIVKDAKWKFTEALGIVEVEKEMKKCIKAGKLFTGSVAIEAIYYYMSKVEGNGKELENSFETIENYIKVLKAINVAMEKMKVDNEKVRQAEFVVAARREGIDPEANAEEAPSK